MVGFFPSLYPDELWYSAIVRFHVHSGMAYWTDTLSLLFPDQTSYPKVGDMMPNETMQQIVRQLPEGALDLRDLALHHSLFPFRLRFLPTQQKQDYLERFCKGEDIQPHLLSITKKLREHPLCYCPMCVQEDRETYGEAYWHTFHQIPLMPLCPRHGCRLKAAGQKTTMPLSRQLVQLPAMSEPIDREAEPWEKSLTELLNRWYTMPFEAEPDRSTDNLNRAAENNGLLAPGSVRRLSWDTERLYQKLVERFGAAVVSEVFGQRITSAHIRRLRQISISTPEEYALLSILLGLGPDALFEGQEIPIALRDRMQALADSGRLFTKQGVASELGIRTEQVMPYAKRFGINPFWVQSGKRKTEAERQGYTVTIHLSREEKHMLDCYMAEQNIQAYSHALRYCMNKELRTWHRSGGRQTHGK